MIDWLTLSLDNSELSASMIEYLDRRQGKIFKISADGQIDWCVPARESIRSDSHQLTVSFGSRIQLTGSPARINGENNVFGSSDICLCALKMIRWASRYLDIDLPNNLMLWRCTRVDFNRNYYLGSDTAVKQALLYLRCAEGPGYHVKPYDNGVGWGTGQSRISGKIYNKGKHLIYQINKKQADASPEHVELADGLIRFEIKITNRFINDCLKHWTQFNETFLQQLHNDYFAPLVGSVEVIDMSDDILSKLEKICKSRRQAKSVYSSWLQIKQIGFVAWEQSLSRSTFYVHKKILLQIGLSYADLQSGNIIPFRRKPIVLGEPVRSWGELKKVASGS